MKHALYIVTYNYLEYLEMNNLLQVEDSSMLESILYLSYGEHTYIFYFNLIRHSYIRTHVLSSPPEKELLQGTQPLQSTHVEQICVANKVK